MCFQCSVRLPYGIAGIELRDCLHCVAALLALHSDIACIALRKVKEKNIYTIIEKVPHSRECFT